MNDAYYVYEDEDHELYYYSVKTKETTYEKPKNKVFLDPETNEIYHFEGDKIPENTSKPKDSNKEEDSSDKKDSSKDESESDNEDSDSDESESSDKEEPKKEEPKKEEPKKEKPKKEEPKKAAPKAVEPKKEEPKVEHKIEETKKEKHKNEDSSKHKKSPTKQKGEKSPKKEVEKNLKLNPDSDSDSDDDDKPKYYVYEDQDKGYYYYNIETKKSTFKKPKGATILDPNTGKKFHFPDSDKKDKKHKKHHSSSTNILESKTSPKPQKLKISESSDQVLLKQKPASDSKSILERPNIDSNSNDMVIDVPNEVSKFDYNESKEEKPRTSFFPDAEKLALPASLQEDIHRFKVDKYAKQFFKEHRTRHFFTRKKVSPEALTSFQDTPLTSSLLTSIPKMYEKDAIQMFNVILGYTGAMKEKVKNATINNLLSIVNNSPILRDELYFQLIKQTNNNPYDDCLLKTWQIFVIVASIYPSSLDSEVWIKSHLSREATKENKTVADYAQFAYIRFSARCTIGKPLEVAPMQSSRIYKDVYESKRVFNASIYEQLWNQRQQHKQFPIPVHVHLMAELLLEKGAENTEGIFRHVGNKKTVTDLIERINKGEKIDTQSIQIHDLASLFKNWFSRLPDSLIPVSFIPQLQNAADDGSFIQFVRKLPKAHLYTLKYLIGFFQRLVKSQSVTKMNEQNLAICFGPDIISTNDVKDLSAFERFKNISIKLLTNLIKDLITDDVYPLVLND